MPIAPPCSFAEWKKPLLCIGIKEEHITDDLIVILSAYNFKADTINDESFQGYFSGTTEHEAGEVVARQFASLNSLQEFLEPIIDWAKAWDSVKTMERYILVKTNELNTWGLFMLE
jgi:hypothetical protein